MKDKSKVLVLLRELAARLGRPQAPLMFSAPPTTAPTIKRRGEPPPRRSRQGAG